MNQPAIDISQLTTPDRHAIAALAEVLLDCVAGGASVSFMQSLTRERAIDYWTKVASDAAAGRRLLLVASDGHGLCGTVQLNVDLPDNQPHRADVAKLLVHRRARRRGVGEALMRAAERAAVRCGRPLLVLDTVSHSPAARLYERIGWVRVGEIPGYALLPAGGLVGTTYYYREAVG